MPNNKIYRPLALYEQVVVTINSESNGINGEIIYNSGEYLGEVVGMVPRGLVYEADMFYIISFKDKSPWIWPTGVVLRKALEPR